MVSFLEGLRNANKAINCFLIGAGGNILGGVASLPGGSPEFIENTTKALRRLAGCDPAEDPVPPSPQFTGGQCVGEPYTVSYVTEQRTSNSAGCTPFANPINRTNLIGGNAPYIGPIGPIVERLVPRPSPSLSGDQTIEVMTGGGMRFLNLGGSTTQSYLVSCGPSYRFSNFQVNRTNGPDDCGDEPPVYPPPVPIEIDIDVTYNIDDGTEVTVTIPFTYAPITTDINGNFRIPFTFNFGDVDFSGNIDLAPEFNLTINPPVGPRGIDSPFTDLPAPDPEIPVEQAPPDERVIGVVVQSQLVGEQQLTTILTEDIPQILAPRCGSVKFGYAIGTRSFWSPDIDIKDLNCFIPCPFSQGADTVAASPAPGVVLNYSPVFGSPLATVADLGSTPEP